MSSQPVHNQPQIPRVWCKQVSAIFGLDTHVLLCIQLDGAILPDCRPTECCWGTSSLLFMGKPLRQVFIQICIYIMWEGGMLWGLGSCCSCSWSRDKEALKPSCGWCVHSSCAVTCAVRPPGAGQGEVRGKSLRTFLGLLQNPQ